MVKVISLGGSLIIPNEIDSNYLNKFKKVIIKYSKKEKFVIVCGGGRTARIYINALRKNKINEKILGYIGIRITRLNAWLLINLFKNKVSANLAKSLKEVKNLLNKKNIVIVGGLRYKSNNTSDGTAATIASILKCDFINMTNVKGLYSKNPKLKGAKFIPKITFDDFYKIANKIKYKAGQHFVLDQSAAKIIKENKIKTYIISGDLKNLEKLLKEKKFMGTVVD
ncbi:UMP kinase [Candidatus Woesearchaeota archaeon]|nr:UMP kinase [Candidatus Woesearchaeota archaeon]